jgi:malonyl-CoA/methylmalonyl-CoA synthetase
LTLRRVADRIGAATVEQAARAAWRVHLGDEHDLDPHALRAGLCRGSLPEAFHAMARRHPERPAVAIGARSLSHGELDDRAGRCARWLAVRGVRPGDHVLLRAPNSLLMLTAYLGALRARATVVLANPALSDAELQHLIRDSGAVLAIGLKEESREDAELELALPDQEPLPPVATDSQETAILAYTSGTTGTPKAVPLTHANLLSSIRAAMQAWRWRDDDVLVHSLPLSHQHGLGGVHATLLAGSRAVIGDRFDPEDLVRTIVEEQATVLFAVPTMYERMAAVGGLLEAARPSLRLAVCGSAPLSPALAARVAAALGSLPLERYGTTETGLDVSNPLEGERRPGSVGLPLPGVELAVVDADGVPVPPGDHGEIVIRGPQVCSGYRGDADATAAAFHPGGWFRTGDIGTIDSDNGYLTITGRSKELIITGGMNVYPREVELALESDPSVERAGVAGLPSEQWGEEVVAAVVPADPARFDGEALLQAMRGRLAGYKRPKRVRAVEWLPVNEMGKLKRTELRDLLASGDYGRMLRAAERRLADAELPDAGSTPDQGPW